TRPSPLRAWRRSVRCFLQAEDGIRDSSVTAVQTCALPIFAFKLNQLLPVNVVQLESNAFDLIFDMPPKNRLHPLQFPRKQSQSRSEERRVGKECRSRASEGPCDKQMPYESVDRETTQREQR